ncbi:hypothetical protein TanjilG_01941 [Lupinus angustifolius]|uniref:F-box protein At2g27310-like n=1 Tax=Lupinus angustifolius TaxID=3871 RepID=UPI00090E31B9|nr:PREDICTED: F-box protein At2g27310-like [Lupinus angustifolius]OIV91323.1 hypothetical protein TanjilG_01941 [Lupinus angustifolius]
MSVAPVESIASLSSDFFYDILRRLDGATLASASCTCATFCSISKEERLWENVCSSVWPSTNREDVKSLISCMGGFRKFCADCFPLIVNKHVAEYQQNNYLEYPDNLTEAEYYGDTNEFEVLESCHMYSKVQNELKEEKLRNESRSITLCILSGIAAFMTLWYCCL